MNASYYFSLLLCAVLSLSAFSENSMPPTVKEKPGITEISEVPWVPSPPASTPKIVYGDDDRIDLYEESDPERARLAYATCAFIDISRMSKKQDGSWRLDSPSAHIRNGFPPCDGEPFANQPAASYCSGFLAGYDIVVTAGHCYNASYFSNTVIVFGFHMMNETTAQLSFREDQVYHGVEIISHFGTGTRDHCVLRLDRPVTASGVQPVKLRRYGDIQLGEFLGVIGYPSGLPLKIAFGNTYVRSISNQDFFVANLDTFGGNSGSPVFNAETGYVEGILVRGGNDYVYGDGCFRSNVVGNDQDRGEDVTRSSIFASFVPDFSSSTGALGLNSIHFGCDDEIVITLMDMDLANFGITSVVVETTNNDREEVDLFEDMNMPGLFSGSIHTGTESVVPNSAILEVGHGDTVHVTYFDEEDDSGNPAQSEITAEIDCIPPMLANVRVSFLGTTQAQIEFNTDEIAKGIVHYGTSCDALSQQTPAENTTDHRIALNNLAAGKRYYFTVEAQDVAGNSSYNDNGGDCFNFVTYTQQNHFTEYFHTQNPVDIEYSQITFVPVDTADFYQACFERIEEFPVPLAGELIPLKDDSFHEVRLPNGITLPFYGIEYDRFFIGSNGYLSFREGSTDYNSVPSQHFSVPRISAAMCDLNPEARGEIYVTRLSDRYVVTFDHVPEYDWFDSYLPENSHSFQIELFYSGIIRINLRELTTDRLITGLSAGVGAPRIFTSVNTDSYRHCESLSYDGSCHSADIDEDWRISLSELLRVIQLFHSRTYSCNAATEDGYQPGPGNQDCFPHNSDYNTQDWKLSLSELLRLIQIYNATGYYASPDTEDGFAIVP